MSPMDYDTFLAIVEEHEPIGRELAERATRAVLRVLGERIDRGLARQLAAQLPDELAPWIATATPAEAFDADEFVRWISEGEGVSEAAAQRHAVAVLDALARAVPDKEWADLVSELPRSFAPLLPRGPLIEVVDVEQFLQGVSERSGLDLEAAKRATDAVLEALAQRIAGGNVDELLLRLPTQLHPALKRGRSASGGQARPIRLEEFVKRVAEIEGVSLLEAAVHARAVWSVLAEAVGEDQFRRIVVQLPDGYLARLPV